MPIFNRICTEVYWEVFWRLGNFRESTEILADARKQTQQGFQGALFSDKKEYWMGVLRLPLLAQEKLPSNGVFRQSWADNITKQRQCTKNDTDLLRGITDSKRRDQSPPLE